MTNQSKKVVLGILGAAAVGAALYVALSPGKATAFKEKFSENFDDIASRVGDFFTKQKTDLKTA